MIETSARAATVAGTLMLLAALLPVCTAAALARPVLRAAARLFRALR